MPCPPFLRLEFERAEAEAGVLQRLVGRHRRCLCRHSLLLCLSTLLLSSVESWYVARPTEQSTAHNRTAHTRIADVAPCRIRLAVVNFRHPLRASSLSCGAFLYAGINSMHHGLALGNGGGNFVGHYKRREEQGDRGGAYREAMHSE